MEGRYNLRPHRPQAPRVSVSASSPSVQEGKEEADDELYLESFNCPILHEPFKNPAIAEDGHTYELSAFQQWVARKKTSPLTGAPLVSTATQDNYAMKKAVAEYKDVVIPKLKVLKELGSGQLAEREALKKAEKENLQKEQEIQQLKRVEKAFYEQRMTLDSVLSSEQQKRNQLQALEAAFFRQSQTLEQTRKQFFEKQQELILLRQAKQVEREYARASCSFAALFSSPNLNGGGQGAADRKQANSDLISAIQGGQVRSVIQALDAGANPNLRVGLDKATPLILAIRLFLTSPEPAKRIIEALSSHGAQPDLGDSKGDRPLHLAAYHNLIWPVTYLLSRKANPLLKNQARETPSEKLLKQRTFKSTTMNRLLRAESRFLRNQEEGQPDSQAYNRYRPV